MIDHELHASWQARLKEQQASGLSIAAWCRDHDVSEHQFHYWKRKFSTKKVKEPPVAVEWTPVVVTDELQSPEQIEDHGITIHVGRVIVSVRPGFNDALLTDIIKVLQSC